MTTTAPPTDGFIETCIHPKEKLYYTIALIFSIVIYLFLIVSIIGLLYGLLIAAFFFVAQGAFTGRLRGNGVRTSPQQFPQVHELTRQLSHQMGLVQVPEVYIVQEGGALNAFATRFLSRSFIVIYSDILELAYNKGEAEVAFVVAHELGHLRLGHLWKRLLLYPAMLIPFLATAYSRACEYSCDAIGGVLQPAGGVGGVLVLAAGKHLYREVNVNAYAAQADEPSDLWMWLGEHLSTHPNLPKRLRALALRDRSAFSSYTSASSMIAPT